jgi:energy-coupling factor transport system substrate-specific component
LLLEKVPRLGGITIMGTVTGLFFLLTGHFPLAFVPGIFFSALADVIQYKSKLPDKMRLTVSYLVFGFSLTGPLLPLWFMKNAYEQSLVARGKSQAYIDQVFKPITTASFVMVVVTIVIGSLVGIWLARRIYQKHFYRLEAE